MISPTAISSAASFRRFTSLTCDAWANLQPLCYLFIFLQYLRRHEPNEAILLNLFVQQIGTAVSARHERSLEGRDTRNHHRHVYYNSTPAPLLALLQG